MKLRRSTLSVEKRAEKKERSKIRGAFSSAARWAAAVITGTTFLVASTSSPVKVQTAQAQDKRDYKITEDDLPTSNIPSPILEPPQFEVQSFALPSNSGEDLVGTSQAYSTPLLDRLMDGDQELARDMVKKTGDALVALKYEGRVGPEGIRNVGEALYNVLLQLPEGKEMQTSTGYNDAMRNLEGCATGGTCDLWAALKALRGETTFNALFDSVNNIYAVAVDQVATPILQTGLVMSLPIGTNKLQFLKYRQDGIKSGFTVKPLSFDVGLNWRWLLIGGELMQLKLDLNEEGDIFFAKEGEMLLNNTDAHVVGLKLSFPIGWSIAGLPVEMTPFISAGWIDWELGANVIGPDGTPEPLTIGQSRFFLDFSGVKFRFPGFLNDSSRFRLEEFGLGFAGITPHLYPLGYATMSLRYYRSANAKLQTYLTAEYGSILNTSGNYENVDKEHRIGLDWRPVVLVFQTKGNVELQGGVGFRYMITVRPEHENYAGETVQTSASHIFAPSAQFGVRFKWWSEQPITIEGRVGYIWEHKGPEGETIPEFKGPGTPFGSLNVIVPLW